MAFSIVYQVPLAQRLVSFRFAPVSKYRLSWESYWESKFGFSNLNLRIALKIALRVTFTIFSNAGSRQSILQSRMWLTNLNKINLRLNFGLRKLEVALDSKVWNFFKFGAQPVQQVIKRWFIRRIVILVHSHLVTDSSPLYYFMLLVYATKLVALKILL